MCSCPKLLPPPHAASSSLIRSLITTASCRLKKEGESPSRSSTPPSTAQKSSGCVRVEPRFDHAASASTFAFGALGTSVFEYEIFESRLTSAGCER